VAEKKGIVLTKKPKNPTIIEGFPGFGLVGTIATGFLTDHLKCEKIGTHYFDDVAPTIAVHECKTVDPISIYYCKKYNIIIIHSILPPSGIEWKAADVVLDVADQLNAKEIITTEGVGSAEQKEESRGFYYSHDDKTGAKMKKMGVDCLGEGIIVGVTGALLLKSTYPLTCVFAETHSHLPDSKAAAKIIEVLDKYLGLDVDYRPLLKQAEAFESQLRTIVEQASKTKDLRAKKETSYIS
jgi:uncharacterized protein